MGLDAALKPLLDALAAGENPPLEEMTPEQARVWFSGVSQLLPAAKPVHLPVVQDRKIPGPSGAVPVPVRVYRPRELSEAPSLPALLFFHGGGWVIGGLDTHDAICRELAAGADCVVVAVDYRLAPEHPYPDGLEDCYAALAWLFEHAQELGVDAARLAVGGDSAGGNLAAAVTLLARERSGPALALQLLIYPATDADFTRKSYRENAEGYFLTRNAMHWFWNHYAPAPAQREEALCAPLRATDLSGLPRALVQTAEFDPLRDEGEAYAERLRKAGARVMVTRYDGVIHGFLSMGALLPAAREAMGQATRTLREAWGAR